MKLEVELRPFTVPNFVGQKVAPSPRQDGYKEAPMYALSDLPAETLHELCEQFRSDVFKKAGKADPREVQP